MDAYVANAALYCADCAEPGDDGPHPNGGGDADCPQHCDACHVHLENPLTADGIEYVAERIADHAADPSNGRADVIRQWREFYADELHDLGLYETERQNAARGGGLIP